MRVLICPDKFKGSLSSLEAADAIAGGIRSARPDWELEIIPIADGGEGTAEVLCDLFHGERRTAQVSDALGRKVNASYGWRNGWAVFEMSQAAGLWRLEKNERDPLRANTHGVGEFIRMATEAGAEKICVGLGGSATNDGGAGMADALGWRFLDKNNQDLKSIPQDLKNLHRIERGIAPPEIIVLSDVRNPLLGEQGATAVFGRQKGVTNETQPLLENALTRLADVVETTLGKSFRDIPGAGAAGGLGFGLLAFCNARLEPGFQWLSKQLDLPGKIKTFDLILTGEGKLDGQTALGKAPAGIAALAREAGKPVIAFAGIVEDAAAFDEALSLLEINPNPEICIARAAEFLKQLAANWAAKHNPKIL